MNTIPKGLYIFSLYFSLLPFTNIINCNAQPPYGGSIFIEKDIISSTDPTALKSITYIGRGERNIYDRRVGGSITINAYLFDVIFVDGSTSEAQVNPEFGSVSAAAVMVDKYAKAIGQLPNVLRTDLDKIWINKGTNVFGGSNRSVLIHTDRGVGYTNNKILNEVLVHEASHTSLDYMHRDSPGWLNAQTLDNNFISNYARDFPLREDISESFLLWFAIRHRANRISQDNYNTITQTIPNRIAYFDNQSFYLYPAIQGSQPYSKTIFMDSSIIIPSDLSSILTTNYIGRGIRSMYDKRGQKYKTVNAFLFEVVWDDGITSEVQVNPEFENKENAAVEAEKYAHIIGQLPATLREGVDKIWINKGYGSPRGGDNALLIHTGKVSIYERVGLLEEVLLYEAANSLLNSVHSNTPGWIDAQEKDNMPISSYAHKKPTQADIAESFLPWFAIRYRPNRIEQDNYNTITQTIPNRLNYFNNQPFNMYPIITEPLPIVLLNFESNIINNNKDVKLSWKILSDVSSKQFSIEKSKDGVIFEKVATIPSPYGSKKTLSSFFIDEHPYYGRSYYKLTKTDYNDNKIDLGLLLVDLPLIYDTYRLSLYPKPFINENISLYLLGVSKNEIVDIKIYSVLGKLKYKVKKKAGSSGSLMLNIPDITQWANGMYIVKVTTKEEVIQTKMIKK